jgi:hypothetical protein
MKSLRCLEIYGRIILNGIFKKWGVMSWKLLDYLRAETGEFFVKAVQNLWST